MLNTILIIDDEPKILNSLRRLLKSKGYSVHTAERGVIGLEMIQENNFGVVLSDHMMPEMNGIEFLEQVKKCRPDIVRILITGYASLENSMDAINRSGISYYLTKPWKNDFLLNIVEKAFEHYNLVEENKRLLEVVRLQNLELTDINENLETLVKERTFQLEEAVREGIIMLATAAETKDDQTGGHIKRIYSLTYEICTELGISQSETEQISFFSMMHDIGKIHIPDNILKKPAKLNVDEWRVMKTHCIAGEKILGTKPFYRIARIIARCHHERWDGNGYPDGLSKKEIPLEARIVTIADVFDALMSPRPYKEAWPFEKTIEEMKRLSGMAFDPEILESFLSIKHDQQYLQYKNNV